MMTGQHYPPEQDQEDEYTSAWKQYELSLSGFITASQFRQLMAGLGEPVSDGEIEQLINTVDGEGKLSCASHIFVYKNSYVS
jgi:Ca2+-binding EF-hand superfamily protein